MYITSSLAVSGRATLPALRSPQAPENCGSCRAGHPTGEDGGRGAWVGEQLSSQGHVSVTGVSTTS